MSEKKLLEIGDTVRIISESKMKKYSYEYSSERLKLCHKLVTINRIEYSHYLKSNIYYLLEEDAPFYLVWTDEMFEEWIIIKI